MSANEQVLEIVRALESLPPDKITEAHDYILFLKHRYGNEEETPPTTDWSDEDLKALSLAVWKRGQETIPWEEGVLPWQ